VDWGKPIALPGRNHRALRAGRGSHIEPCSAKGIRRSHARRSHQRLTVVVSSIRCLMIQRGRVSKRQVHSISVSMFIDWRFIAFVVLMLRIVTAFVAIVIQNALLYLENQMLRRRVE
jgi:hypothetical protein